MYSRKEPRAADIVIVTHTLGSVPITDMPAIVARIYTLAKRAVYVGETLGVVPRKKVFSELQRHAVGWTKQQWLDLLAPAPAGVRVRAGFLDAEAKNLDVVDVLTHNGDGT
jgi:hypothetical protein